jgi:hypothetical protein
MTIAHLRAAARLAHEASQGRRTIELVVTEEGVFVLGRVAIGLVTGRASRTVAWPELSSPADLASNAVELVDRELSAMEGRA